MGKGCRLAHGALLSSELLDLVAHGGHVDLSGRGDDDVQREPGRVDVLLVPQLVRGRSASTCPTWRLPLRAPIARGRGANRTCTAIIDFDQRLIEEPQPRRAAEWLTENRRRAGPEGYRAAMALVLVTGGSRDIGAATAVGLARDRHDIAVAPSALVSAVEGELSRRIHRGDRRAPLRSFQGRPARAHSLSQFASGHGPSEQ
jgi:hypothetical protein